MFKIFKVFHEVKGITTTVEKSLGVTRGEKLCAIIFIIIRSGMALFVIQLARVVITALGPGTNADFGAYTLIVGVHIVLNVIQSSAVVLYFTDNVDVARV